VLSLETLEATFDVNKGGGERSLPVLISYDGIGETAGFRFTAGLGFRDESRQFRKDMDLVDFF
jgi:hypothetical protein